MKLTKQSILCIFVNLCICLAATAPRLPRDQTTIMKSPLPIAPVGIVVANPDRAVIIAKDYFDYYFVHTDFRGYKVYVGEYKQRRMFVAYIGLGSASAAFLTEELIAYDAEVIIRLGSNDFNVTKDDVNSVYVIKSCHGLIGMFQDLGYPYDRWGEGVDSDAGLYESLIENGESFHEIDVWRSIGYNVDSFYAFMNPSIAHDPVRLQNLIDHYQNSLGPKAEKLCRDMETCSVLLISQLRGIRAASVLQAVVKYETTHEDVGTTGIQLVLQTLYSESVKLEKEKGTNWVQSFNKYP